MTADEIRQRLEAAGLTVGFFDVWPSGRIAADLTGTQAQWEALISQQQVVVTAAPDAPAALLEAICNLDAAIERCADVAGNRRAVYQWLKGIIITALERMPKS